MERPCIDKIILSYQAYLILPRGVMGVVEAPPMALVLLRRSTMLSKMTRYLYVMTSYDVTCRHLIEQKLIENQSPKGYGR